MKLDEMTPALRKAALAALARDLSARQTPAPARTAASKHVGRSSCSWRCARCGECFPSWAACARHGDTARHARFEIVLDETGGE